MYYPKYVVITTKLWSSHHFFASFSSSVRYRIETFIRQFSNFVNYRFLNEILCITLIYKNQAATGEEIGLYIFPSSWWSEIISQQSWLLQETHFENCQTIGPWRPIQILFTNILYILFSNSIFTKEIYESGKELHSEHFINHWAVEKKLWFKGPFYSGKSSNISKTINSSSLRALFRLPKRQKSIYQIDLWPSKQRGNVLPAQILDQYGLIVPLTLAKFRQVSF